MSCAHCCRNFGKGTKTQGQHMDSDTFQRCLDLAIELEEGISLGGGEPLSHPEFWDFWQQAMRAAQNTETGVWLATSGHNRKRTLDLITIAANSPNGVYLEDLLEFEDEFEPLEEGYEDRFYTEKGQRMAAALWYGTPFSMALSIDPFHDPIEPQVVEQAKRAKIEIRNNYNKIKGLTNRGRAKSNQMGDPDNLTCEGISADWKGNIFICSTVKKGKLGNIHEDYSYIYDCFQRMYEKELPECKHHWKKKHWKWVTEGK